MMVKAAQKLMNANLIVMTRVKMEYVGKNLQWDVLPIEIEQHAL